MEYTSYVDVEVLGRSEESYPAERPVRRTNVRRRWCDDVLIADDFSEADLFARFEPKAPGGLSC